MSLSLIWSLFNVVLIGYTFYKIWKLRNNDISDNYIYQRIGANCYKCNSDLIVSPLDRLRKLANNKEDLTLCKQCNRDERLEFLESGKIKSSIINFKSYLIKFLMSDRWKKFSLIMNISIPATLVIHYILYFSLNIGFFLWINYSIVTINFILILYQNSLRYK